MRDDGKIFADGGREGEWEEPSMWLREGRTGQERIGGLNNFKVYHGKEWSSKKKIGEDVLKTVEWSFYYIQIKQESEREREEKVGVYWNSGQLIELIN